MEASKMKLLKLYILLMSLAIAFLGYKVLTGEKEDSGIIRVQGIIIEDHNGNDRILIGAPVPESKDRVRTDTVKVRSFMGERYYKVHSPYYHKYKHEANGIIIPDENGIDRLALGDPVPDPNVGPRIGPATGIAINNSKGFERSGYGLLKVNGKDRVTLGLDAENGEGVMLFILENGMAGLLINDPNGPVYLGKADSVNWFAREAVPFKGIVIRDSTQIKYLLNSYEKKEN